jgi:hypothetical protein
MKLFIDRIHRLPRIWSNRELSKFSSLFGGHVVNVSGWKDIDKEGRQYRDYFTNAESYTLTNYKAEARGYQGLENEIFLDLEQTLPDELHQRFDVVFNHTTLEHVYDLRQAFGNLCLMSKDVIILVVPFLQPYHSEYGDYWRFSPLAVKRLFQDNGCNLLYLSFNNHRASAVYIFAIASKCPDKWKAHFNYTFTCLDPEGDGEEPYIGFNAIPNSLHRWIRMLKRLR